MLTKDRSNTTMYRKVIRGNNNTQRRRAEDHIRFGGAGLEQRNITDREFNWIGIRYAEKILGHWKKLPSIAQIREGLAGEAELQMKLAMGDIQD